MKTGEHLLVRADGTYPARPLEKDVRYPLDLVSPAFDQYRQEVPMNHLDLPVKEMPQTGEEMKKLMDAQSRWLNPEKS